MAGTTTSTIPKESRSMTQSAAQPTPEKHPVSEGKKAPDFSLKNQDGKVVKLSGFKGKNVVLYFYPKDGTPGCTTEACAFRDAVNLNKLKALDAVVVGISPDDVASHNAFWTKFLLGFDLLSDPDHKVAEKYGSWGEKVQYGKRTMGIIRSTFIIDKKGVIKKMFPKVKVDGHAEEVLAALRGD
ncbi:MAG: thioredoxin-dependent thiol peroxidase [Planctomycetes bacterium]|nr:thioredoxin-dependent thiol peroxidase [Planctomycetota bacterium]